MVVMSEVWFASVARGVEVCGSQGRFGVHPRVSSVDMGIVADI